MVRKISEADDPKWKVKRFAVTSIFQVMDHRWTMLLKFLTLYQITRLLYKHSRIKKLTNLHIHYYCVRFVVVVVVVDNAVFLPLLPMFLLMLLFFLLLLLLLLCWWSCYVYSRCCDWRSDCLSYSGHVVGFCILIAYCRRWLTSRNWCCGSDLMRSIFGRGRHRDMLVISIHSLPGLTLIFTP